jgi:hypothetical protein
MLTFHHSFSTRIFPFGDPSSREAKGRAAGLSPWRRDYQSRGLSAPKPSSRGTTSPASTGKRTAHAR